MDDSKSKSYLPDIELCCDAIAVSLSNHQNELGGKSARSRGTGEPYPYPHQTDLTPRGSGERNPYKYQDGNIYP